MAKEKEQLDILLEELPALSSVCENFCSAASGIAERRAVNKRTLQHHSTLIELLEIPQLMDTCVRNGRLLPAVTVTFHTSTTFAL